MAQRRAHATTPHRACAALRRLQTLPLFFSFSKMTAIPIRRMNMMGENYLGTPAALIARHARREHHRYRLFLYSRVDRDHRRVWCPGQIRLCMNRRVTEFAHKQQQDPGLEGRHDPALRSFSCHGFGMIHLIQQTDIAYVLELSLLLVCLAQTAYVLEVSLLREV